MKVTVLNKRTTKRNNYGNYWRDTSKEDIEALGSACEICGSTKNIQRHHIVFRSKGGQNCRLNLQLLCKSCHMAKHKRK